MKYMETIIYNGSVYPSENLRFDRIMSERKISDLKPGMERLNLEVRVLEAYKPKVVKTKKGLRTLSEAIVGDETGRVKLTLWGQHAGSLEEGSAVRIEGAFTTAFKGEVQLNIGVKGKVEKIDDDRVVQASEVPENKPKAYRGSEQARYTGRKQFKPRR